MKTASCLLILLFVPLFDLMAKNKVETTLEIILGSKLVAVLDKEMEDLTNIRNVSFHWNGYKRKSIYSASSGLRLSFIADLTDSDGSTTIICDNVHIDDRIVQVEWGGEPVTLDEGLLGKIIFYQKPHVFAMKPSLILPRCGNDVFQFENDSIFFSLNELGVDDLNMDDLYNQKIKLN